MSVRSAWGIACPMCGEDDRIDIAATVWLRLSEDGTDPDEAENGDHEWSPTHACACRSCGHEATVALFTVVKGN